MTIIVTWENGSKCAVEANETDAKSTIRNLLQHGCDPTEIAVYNAVGISSVHIAFNWISTEDEE